MDGRESQFLRVLAELDLPGRWAALVASGLPEAPPEPGGGIDLYRAEQMLDDIGVPFRPKEYDDEDYWPMRRVERYADHALILTISSPDPSGVHSNRLEFGLEIILTEPAGRTRTYGGRLPRLIIAIGRHLDPAGAPPEPPPYFLFLGRDEARRAFDWFLDLSRAVSARTTELSWPVPDGPYATDD